MSFLLQPAATATQRDEVKLLSNETKPREPTLGVLANYASLSYRASFSTRGGYSLSVRVAILQTTLSYFCDFARPPLFSTPAWINGHICTIHDKLSFAARKEAICNLFVVAYIFVQGPGSGVNVSYWVPTGVAGWNLCHWYAEKLLFTLRGSNFKWILGVIWGQLTYFTFSADSGW